MIEVVTIEEAVGFPLAHDITEIRPGEFKGAAFHRGHILKREDLDHLRRLGKNHLFIIKGAPEELIHEDEAAVDLADALCGQGVGWNGEPREGKLSLTAQYDGLLKVDVEALNRFNRIGEVMCATRHSDSIVKKGQEVAATRAIPLLVARRDVAEAIQIAHSAPQRVLRILPMKRPTVGVMITGDEVYYGRIDDKFEPVIRRKIAEVEGRILEIVFLPDDDQRIAETAQRLVAAGVDMLITTGGMSVDPDDRTRFALQKAGMTNMVYGSAVLPGAMFMVGQIGAVPVLGIPACGLFAPRTVFDLIFPRVLAGEKISRRDLADLGHGGLCLKCKSCTYPVCPFGK
jgi:hypothetical protein